MTAFGLVMFQAVLGAVVVWLELKAESVVLHLATAMTLVAVLIYLSISTAVADGTVVPSPDGRRVAYVRWWPDKGERALVVADLPFGSYQGSPQQAFDTSVRFMKEANAQAVKLEGGHAMVPQVELLTDAGIPVMAHIGFTPQSEHNLGGYRVQGRGGFGIGPRHAQQHGMNPRQHRRVTPFAQPPAQGRAGRATVVGGKFAPLDALAQEKP